MTILTDASTPARFSATGAATMSSASFTAPAGSVLLVEVMGVNDTITTVTVTDDLGLTWTTRVAKQSYFSHGWVYGATAAVASAAARVVTVTTNSAPVFMTARCQVITGADTASPVGATHFDTSSANTGTGTYTSTVDNSLGFGWGSEWNELGVPTSSDTIDDAFDSAGNMSGIFVHKAAVTTPASTVVNQNFDAFGAAGAEWAIAVVEILPSTIPVASCVTSNIEVPTPTILIADLATRDAGYPMLGRRRL